MMFVSFYVKSDFNKDYIDNIVIEEKDIYSTNDVKEVEDYIVQAKNIYGRVVIINWKIL